MEQSAGIIAGKGKYQKLGFQLGKDNLKSPHFLIYQEQNGGKEGMRNEFERKG